jgi:hypothetical protein
VNAQNEPELNLEDVGFFQSLSLMMGVASGIQIRRFNFETMDLLRTSFQGWAKQIDRPGHPFHFHLVEVGFAGVRNDEVRTALNNLPTSFKLDADDVELLKATGRNVLARSSGFAAALDDIGRWHGELAADPAVSDDGSVDGSGELEDAAADP